MKNVFDTQYFINDGCIVHEIEKLTNMKDLSVIFDSELSSRDYIELKINITYGILGLIKEKFHIHGQKYIYKFIQISGKTTPGICQLGVVTLRKSGYDGTD